jgi:hypothetical protein
MLRISSLFVIIFLMVPMVRECCLPVITAPPCHQSKPTDDSACTSNQAAITEAKSSVGVTKHFEYLPSTAGVNDVQSYVGFRSHINAPVAVCCGSSNDLYLGTGALLI